MIIKKASDLHFTYVRNTPELRDAFIAKCNEFGIGVFGLGGENYLEVYSDGYDEFEICGTDSLESQSKELTMSDLTDIPTETPEEKEVLDVIESAGEVEWKSGDECVIRNDNDRYSIYDVHKKHVGNVGIVRSVFKTTNGTEIAAVQADNGDCVCWRVDMLKKPETPQQREERERACAIYDMCAEADIFTEESNFWAGKFYDLGYKKEKSHGAN